MPRPQVLGTMALRGDTRPAIGEGVAHGQRRIHQPDAHRCVCLRIEVDDECAPMAVPCSAGQSEGQGGFPPHPPFIDSTAIVGTMEPYAPSSIGSRVLSP